MRATPHKYDNPLIGSEDFLLAIMRDPTVALAIRLDAAAKLLPIYRDPTQTLHITVTGGLPALSPEQTVAFEVRNRDMFDWRDRAPPKRGH